MTVSRLRLRLPKSETREIAEQMAHMRRIEVEAWRMSDPTFFTAFVVLAGVIALAVLVLR